MKTVLRIRPSLRAAAILPAMLVAAMAVAQTPIFDLQGHRGCRGLMPENTVPAMIRALQVGVTTLEMDVVVSRDRQVVVSHDPFMNADFCLRPDGRTIDKIEEKELRLYAMDYAEIARWDVGSRPNPKFPDQLKMAVHKPTLTTLIDSVESYARQKGLPSPHYNIETKCKPAGDGLMHPKPDEFVSLLMEVIEHAGIAARVTIQSFDIRTLKVIHKSYPGIHTSLLIEASDKVGMEGRLAELGFIPAVYSPASQLVTPELVKACHAKGMRVIPWTVNEATEMQRLKNMGVDGLISDYPNKYLPGG